jgi:ADP-ribosyl-[dinitrogen reductase] hydrolase
LLGGAVGDALGAPIEFASLREIRARFGADGLLELAPGFGPSGRLGAITDDTQMTLFTAEGLTLAARDPALAGRSGMVRSVHRAYLRWLRTQGERSAHPTFERTDEGWLLGTPALHSPRGPGNTCLSALRASRMGSAEQPLNHSKGCGGVMRIAPVGLTRAVDDPFAVGCAIAAITHGHPTGFLAAGFQALAIREVVAGTPLRSACQEAMEELSRRPSHQECAAAVERALSLSAEKRGQASPEDVASLGEGWVAEEALAIALFCALAAPDFESAVRLAVNHGGDSDSTGAITGNLLGAALGEAVIPARWLAALELREEIERVADELVETPRSPTLQQ